MSFGTVTDIDGNVYETVQIGDQVWMAENLKTTHYNNGDEITYTNGSDWGSYTGEYTFYNDNPVYADIYGNLYNWYAIDDERGVCPDGFHVPSDEEFTELINYLGGTLVAGGKMKEEGLDHWNSPNTGATNESGFTALPGGFRDYEDIDDCMWAHAKGWFWSSSGMLPELDYSHSEVHMNSWNKRYGFSIRCMTLGVPSGCTDPEACNYDDTATADDGSCAYEYDCAGTCGGELEFDCCGVCDGDNSQCSNCCGSPFNEDCTDDCAIDTNGVCCYELEVDACGECNGDGTDCNNDGIPDDCEEAYTSGYNIGYMNGVITGQIGSDENNDGLVDDFPLITVLGGTTVVLTQTHESNYIDEGASCFAGEYNLFQNVAVSGAVVNLSSIGTYVINYDCQDNVSGNQAITKHRTVIVQADYSDEDNDGYDDASYIAGLEEGVLIGAQSGDANGDGELNILDIVYFIDVILNP